jgi:hypothetical protein
MDWKEMKGGNKASGFIAAMMARKSNNQEVKDNFKEKVDEKNRGLKGKKRKKAYTADEINKFKFGALDRKGFDLKKLSKTTHDVVKRTETNAVKSFHEYVLKNAQQHQPLSGKDPVRNYRKTYDLENMYEQWKNQEPPKEVKEEKKESKEERKARKAEKEKRKAEKEEKRARKAEKEKRKAEKKEKKEKEEKEAEEPVDYELMEGKQITGYRCGSCGKPFLQQSTLDLHNRTKHPGVIKKLEKD